VSEMGKRPYRLGLDMGSNSLGWFVVWLDDKGNTTGLGPGGVRVYPDGRDPKSKTSNAVDRRTARGARRRRDRYLKRRSLLMSLLIQHGLMPEDPAARKLLETLDPYELRAKALDGGLLLHHFGRALFHLDQRRGFLSNRKTEKKEREPGIIKEAAGKLQAAMENENARTLGEFLYWRHRVRKGVRARNKSTGAKAEYDFYPTRQMTLDEFNKIWDTQAPHHPTMTSEARVAIGHAIFDQRPLKRPPVGKCSLDPARDSNDTDGFRCPWAHPLAQRFRIWQEVRNLEIAESGRTPIRLPKEQGDVIALALFQNGKLSFDKIRGLLKLPPEAKLNLESDKRTELLGDQTAAKLSGKTLFGKAWRSFPLARQVEIVMGLLETEDEAKLIEWLMAETGLDGETAARAADAFLPDGHCRLGLRAIKKIVPFMERGMNYPEAAKAVEYDHAQLPDGVLSPNGYLPYYGEWLQDDVLGSGDPRHSHDKRWGRFPNPTVHIGLGQLRRTVNALIREYGPPSEIAVEMTRAFKLSPKQLSELESEQAKNQRKNDARREELHKLGQADNARNLLKLRLWEELNLKDPMDRQCPFTGEVIGIARLLSDEVEIEHLIPFQDSWDDSAANKTVSMRYANRAKGMRTPCEAFGSSPTIDGRHYDWNDISQRAAGLPKGKRWRFDPDARNRFNAMGGFQARQLNETGWLARVARHYLGAVTNPNKINVLPGKLTAMIRSKWGLNTLLSDHNFSDTKNRKDHRHHAIDAMVAAMTDRSLLHRMSSAYDEERDKIEIQPPWRSLRDDLAAKLHAMTVSHKSDHGTQGRLFRDTAYGAVKDSKREQESNRNYLVSKGVLSGAEPKKAEAHNNLVYRKPFVSLNANEIARIRDIRLRELVRQHIESKEPSSAEEFKAALQSFAERSDISGLPNGLRRVRLVEVKEPSYMIPVRRESGEIYKLYFGGENAFVEVFETPDGKWDGEAISVFKTNQEKTPKMEWPDKFPGAKFVMRIFKGDLIALDFDGLRTVMVVRQLDAAAGRFKLAAHNEGGPLQDRHESKKPEYENDPFRWLMASYGTLKAMKAEQVRVDEVGRLWRVKSNRDAVR
jgi:CRISPR-associated endonuclease Csn1